MEDMEYRPDELDAEEPFGEAESEAVTEDGETAAEDGKKSGGKHAKGKKEKEKPSAKKEFYDWLQCVMAALLTCVLVFAFFARMVGVVGDSMTNTLHDGDRIVISKLFYTPEQGDIVVLRKESFREHAIVKRVIAVEGQTVSFDFDQGIVYVDGKALDEPYIREPTYTSIDFTADEVTVPEGCVFVMGDNRNGSTDSRDNRIGFVDTRCIIGRMLFRVFPLDDFGTVD